jgi:hypothetical protein
MAPVRFYLAWAALALLSGAAFGQPADAPRPPAVAELLEDDAAGLLKQLTNPTGDIGEGHPENKVVFSGTTGIRIVPMQRFHPTIPGWKYRIVEKPGPGEYRYLRFAWKADGCAGIMVQMHDERDWFIRYTAGVDRHNWGTKFVAATPPGEWTVVTCDLFRDFGPRTLTGIALTAFDGRAAYFDHIYLGRTVEDLDRVDATGLRKGKPVRPTPAALDRLWADLAGADASAAYLAFWTLVAAPDQAVPFLRRQLTTPPSAVSSDQIRAWIRDLDHDRFAIREKATRLLEQHLDGAAGLLERELARTSSAEVRTRIQRLLAARAGLDTRRERVTKAVRVLEYAATPSARKALEELAAGQEGAQAVEAAKDALRRLRETEKK